MASRVEKGEVSRPEAPMYLSYAQRFREGRELEDKCASVRRLTRRFLYIVGAYLCNLDLEASRAASELNSPKGQSTTTTTTKVIAGPHIATSQRLHLGPAASEEPAGHQGRSRWSLPRSAWKRQLRFGWIHPALLAWYLGSLVFLATAACFQYAYDIDLLRLQALDRQRELNFVNPIAVNRTQLAERLVASKRALQWFGAEFSHLTIMVEAFYWIVLGPTTILTIPIFLHHKLERPFDQYALVRDLLDSARERVATRRLVAEQVVARFLESSRSFYRNIVDFHDTAEQAPRTAGHLPRKTREPTLGLAFRRERETRELVREMLQAGSLTPLYKLPPWAMWRFLLLLSCFIMLSSGVLFAYVVLIYAFFMQSKSSAAASRGTHILVACMGPWLITAPSALVHLPLTIVVTHEQNFYVAQLRRMIRRCIELDRQLVLALRRASVVAPTGAHKQVVGVEDGATTPALITRSADHANARALSRAKLAGKLNLRAHTQRTLNSNLLLVLLHYKLFVVQLRPLTQTLGVMNNVVLSLLFYVPLVMRLHQPYLTQLSVGWLSTTLIKLVGATISGAVLAQANVVSAPLCHLSARCRDLYKDLSSLVAQMSESKLRLGLEGAWLYNEHAEHCLHRELADSRRFLAPITVKRHGLSGTYNNFLKALFWYGIVLISILQENSCATGGPQDELLRRFVNDPLGVYKQIKCV